MSAAVRFLKRGLLDLEARLAPALHRRDRLDGTFTILTFHRVLPERLRREYAYPELVVTPEELGRVLAWAMNRYAIDTVARHHAAWTAGEEGGPRLSVTFDDGQYDNFLYAAPVLDRLGVPGTFYVPVGPLDEQTLIWHDWLGFGLQEVFERHGRDLQAVWPRGAEPGRTAAACIHALKSVPDAELGRLIEFIRERVDPASLPDWSRLMHWDEVAALAERGHEIGSHAVTHRILTNLPHEEAAREILDSKVRLESVLGREVTSFCYPNGNHDPRLEAACADAGYGNATTTLVGINEDPGANAFALSRLNMDATQLVTPFERFSPSRAACYVQQASIIQSLRTRA